ncbi:MAG TPA: DUF4136 domain-containing protein [Chakrabartia sp.]|jgi:hypothetical protein|nr:DUF4136 domain-containing protein [Chakrabartia sp.]
MLRRSSLFRLAAPLALLAVTGCAQNFNARVNRFQAMPPVQGQSFVIKAEDPKLDGSLEFATYAGLVSQRLTGLGYTAAASPDAAALVVKIGYGVDKGTEKVRTVPTAYGYGNGGCWGWHDPFCGGSYWGAGFARPYAWRGGTYYHGWMDPWAFGGGSRWGSEVESYTVFTSDLSMKIEKSSSAERVFEGNAKALSTNDNLTYLVPNLIEAMFTGFPGNSGETVRITVAPPKKK